MLFSCSADDLADTEKTSEVNKTIDLKNQQANAGPDDDPVPVTPPKK